MDLSLVPSVPSVHESVLRLGRNLGVVLYLTLVLGRAIGQDLGLGPEEKDEHNPKESFRRI
jgi:hypothetical protein